jgi:hypothetical protein
MIKAINGKMILKPFRVYPSLCSTKVFKVVGKSEIHVLNTNQYKSFVM